MLPQTDPGPCHHNLHLTSTPHTLTHTHAKSQALLPPHHRPPPTPTLLQSPKEKEEENQKSPCAIFIWREPKKRKEYGENVLMPQIHTGGGTTLSAHGPKKTSKAHLHARVVRHLYCFLTFTKWRGKKHLHFQIVIMGIDSQTNMIQNELCECGEQ